MYFRIVAEVKSILSQYDMPLTLRQIFYRLVAKGVIPNTVNSYKRLSRILVKAREKGDIDDSRIEDRSRQVLGIGDFGYEDLDSFINMQIERLKECWYYWTRAMWKDQPKNVIIVLEKDALSRLFTDVADDYRVKVYPTRGYGSYTYVKDLARHISLCGKHTVVLYFGDYDPSGRDIERDLTDRLKRYGAEDFEVIRVALTREQIHMYNLPPKPEDAETLAKLMRDPRSKTYGLDYACELDALEPDILKSMIKDAIIRNIDVNLWNKTIDQINEERKKLKEKLSKMKVIFE